MTEKLKPCPFCGGIAKLFSFDVAYNPVRLKDWELQCMNDDCGVTTGTWYTKEQAINVWNRRVGDE